MVLSPLSFPATDETYSVNNEIPSATLTASALTLSASGAATSEDYSLANTSLAISQKTSR